MKRKTIIIFTVILIIGGLFGFMTYNRLFRDPTPPSVKNNDTVRVACVGDSLTFGHMIAWRHKNSYPARLQTLLGKDYQVLNYGANARTLQNGADMPYAQTRLYPASLASQPQIVLIMLGTNDTKTHNWNALNYEADLRELVRAYQALESEPRVYLLQPPAVYDNPYTITDQTVREEILPIMARVSQELGTGLIDVYTPTSGDDSLVYDGVHFKPAGVEIIADTVFHALSR
ncbi:MAG: GDSL-type esterase/lipase family protein [Oscillospiraceae bacterium]|nr:GDSL-type esterase/lipase family protein [Oscillospiraceae bacterium]